KNETAAIVPKPTERVAPDRHRLGHQELRLNSAEPGRVADPQRPLVGVCGRERYEIDQGAVAHRLDRIARLCRYRVAEADRDDERRRVPVGVELEEAVRDTDRGERGSNGKAGAGD